MLAATCVALMVVPAVAPADVEEQRSRLPPPASCGDPVEGLWMSHAYFPHVGAWYVDVLEIHRTGPGASTLTGETRVEYWHGGPADSRAPACGPGVVRRRISARAVGSISGLDLTWQGVELGPEIVLCGPPLENYELLTFRGTIDPALQEFQNVIMAGPVWTDIRTVFRRFQCFDGSAPPVAPPTPIAPPPFQPSGGCCQR